MTFALCFTQDMVAVQLLWKKGMPHDYFSLGCSPSRCIEMHKQCDQVEIWARKQSGFWWRQQLYHEINFTRWQIDQSQQEYSKNKRTENAYKDALKNSVD